MHRFWSSSLARICGIREKWLTHWIGEHINMFSLSIISQQWDGGDSSNHYNDVIMGAIASQITSHTIVYSNVYSDADQRKHQSSASLAFVRGIHRWPVNSPHKWPVTRKRFPFACPSCKRPTCWCCMGSTMGTDYLISAVMVSETWMDCFDVISMKSARKFPVSHISRGWQIKDCVSKDN